MNLATLSVSIVIYDLDTPIFDQSLESLRRALAFCIAKEKLNHYAITIVDNGENRDALVSLLTEGENYVQSASNIGFGAAHNRAIHDSNTDYHLILNPDLILDETAVAGFIELAQTNTDIVLIGPRGVSAEGEDAFLAKRYPALLDLFLRGFAPKFIKRRFNHRLANYEYQDIEQSASGYVDVQLISGCCMFVRTKQAQVRGAFDEQFFLYFEDFDFSLNMSNAGRVVYAQDIAVIHYGGNSARKGLHHIWLFCRSARKFYNKHGWKFT